MNYVQSLKADIANLSVKVLMKADHRHTWTGKNKSIRFETCIEIDTPNKFIDSLFVRGTVDGGVNLEDTYIRVIENATQRCVDFLKHTPKKSKVAQKGADDLRAIHRVMWKLAADDVISEIILRTCDVIEKDPKFTPKDMLNVVKLLKTRASQHVSNLFTEEQK